MKTTNLTAACSVLALVMSFGAAAFANDVPVGCLSECDGPDDPKPKGNNGWGNGIDGENPGSDEGPDSQVDTKMNDTVWDKFDGKFEGR